MSTSSSLVKKLQALTPSKKQNLRHISDFQDAIVSWFEKSARDLPWRKTSDPYRIWISEIMLQQTQVATVIPFYDRFLKRFPVIESLAESSESEVLKYWEGLGYYRRGKNLRRAAQFIVEKFCGKFPETRDDLLSVPGIGPYSAGAILSIAFRKQAPALDGNLIRVYSRFFGIRDCVDEASTLKKLWVIATQHVPKNPHVTREFAEGMMELGALLCTPRNPSCVECPVRKLCSARLANLTSKIPKKRGAKLREKYMEAVSVRSRGDKIALFSMGTDPKYPDFMRLPYSSLAKVPMPSKVLKKFKYSITHRDFEVYLMKGKVSTKKLVWIERSQLKEVLLPAIDRRILSVAKTLPGIF